MEKGKQVLNFVCHNAPVVACYAGNCLNMSESVVAARRVLNKAGRGFNQLYLFNEQ